MNFFEFFNLPVSFVLDTNELKARYYANSRKYHPDFHTLADEGEQARMLELAGLNNQAYQTLSDSDRRMRYVLQLSGALQEEGEQNRLPQEFLMEMMDINENLMELEFNFDAEQLQTTRSAVHTMEQELDAEIKPLLQNWQADQPFAQKELEKIRDYYLKKRYLLRIQENMSKFAAP